MGSSNWGPASINAWRNACSPAILKEEERNFHLALARVIAEGRRLHDAKVPIARAVESADFGSFATWTRYTDNVAGALTRVYLELDGALGP